MAFQDNVGEVPLNLTRDEANALLDHLNDTSGDSPHLSSIKEKLGQAGTGSE